MVTHDVEPLFNQQRPTNFCQDGKCSGCGNCCSNCLPLTAGEIKTIKAYISRHNIKPENHCRPGENDIDWICPFRDEVHRRCNIYEARPAICQFFRCDMKFDASAIKRRTKGQRKFVDVRMTFYPRAKYSEDYKKFSEYMLYRHYKNYCDELNTKRVREEVYQDIKKTVEEICNS